jgi:hypothetical protein
VGEKVIDIDVRALQVRRLDDLKLAVLHAREREQGYRFPQDGIARRAGLPDLKAAYGVPNKPKPIKAWAATVRQVMGRFLRERQLRVSLDDLEALHAFDRAVAASDLDFQYRTATPAKRVKDWFEP